MNSEILTSEEGNHKISEWLLKGDRFAVSRMGLTEMQIIYCHTNNLPIPPHIKHHLYVGGVYRNTVDEFCQEYIKGISCGDLQTKWEGSTIDLPQEDIFKKCCQKNKFVKAGATCVEPFYFKEPWSKELNGKTILVISPFSHTIKHQFEKKNLLWENKELLPDFNLINYTSVQSIGGNGPHSSWKDSLNIMKNEISKIQFDVALLGCGPYGLPLLAHIKESLGKSGIYIGGGLRVLFGIKGKRWDGMPNVNRFYNENWRRPLDIEIPEEHNLVEGGCYW